MIFIMIQLDTVTRISQCAILNIFTIYEIYIYKLRCKQLSTLIVITVGGSSGTDKLKHLLASYLQISLKLGYDWV